MPGGASSIAISGASRTGWQTSSRSPLDSSPSDTSSTRPSSWQGCSVTEVNLAACPADSTVVLDLMRWRQPVELVGEGVVRWASRWAGGGRRSPSTGRPRVLSTAAAGAPRCPQGIVHKSTGETCQGRCTDGDTQTSQTMITTQLNRVSRVRHYSLMTTPSMDREVWLDCFTAPCGTPLQY